MKLFLKISNECDHDSSTSRTDGRTDRETTYRSNRRNRLQAMSPNTNDLVSYFTSLDYSLQQHIDNSALCMALIRLTLC